MREPLDADDFEAVMRRAGNTLDAIFVMVRGGCAAAILVLVVALVAAAGAVTYALWRWAL